jgi:hypothetical protein
LNIDKISEQVKYNCNISDAQYWGYYSICGMLMRLRELYRHEHSFTLWQSIPKEEISPWIAERENLWEELGNTSFKDIEILGRCFNPFNSDEINSILKDQGYVYSSGYGMFHKPMFFLAHLKSENTRGDYNIFYAEQEICHDLSTSAAMLQGQDIYIRLEPLTILLWHKSEEAACGTKKILRQAFDHYGINPENFSYEDRYQKLKNLSSDVAEILVSHELGEARETQKNPQWLDIIENVSDRFTEFYLRAIKDLLADTSENGPLQYIYTQKDRGLLLFYLAFIDGIRKQLFPEILDAFNAFSSNEDWTVIEGARRQGYEKMTSFKDKIIEAWNKENSLADITTYLKKVFQN